MKHKVFAKTIRIIVLLLTGCEVQAQVKDCVFKDPVVKIDFSKSSDIDRINIFPLSNYRLVNSTCPEDGNYSFVSETSGCFNDDWLTFNEDHTREGANGKMMLVNASPDGGMFLNTVIKDLTENKVYQLSVSMVNVCRISGGCSPLPPNIVMKLLTLQGQPVCTFSTGLLSQNAVPKWRVYSGTFTAPANATALILTMEDVTTGGCGNDFALDDITVRGCVRPAAVAEPAVGKLVSPEVAAATEAVKKIPALKKEAKITSVKSAPAKRAPVTRLPQKNVPVKDTTVYAVKKPVINPPQVAAPVQQKPVLLPVPKQIATRSNPLIKQIETEAGEIKVDLFDNGEIDGDTVSIYHNNELIVSKARLSTKPVSFSLKIDTKHPHHVLVMVADNLGSIPPNTSMMILKANDKRYEVFISSTEQQNARIEIDLKEKN